MSFFVGFLTVLLVLDCLFLVLLVLIQLPKKDAGAGLAFGGMAADALFGAGSGNVLTRMTKYVATVFFVLTIMLSILNTRLHLGTGRLELPTDLEGAPPAAVPTEPVARPATPAVSTPPATPTVPESSTPPPGTGEPAPTPQR